MTVAFGLDELGPRVAFKLLLELKRITDFLHLELNHLVLGITIGVALGERVQGLLVAALGNVETGRLRHEPDESQLEERWESLHERRCAPRPVAHDVVGAKGEPGGDDGAKVPRCVVDSREYRAVLRVHKLRDEKGRGAVGNGDAEPDEEARGHEHADVARDRLEHHAEQHDDAANHDASATAQNIGGVGHGRNGDERAHGHDAVE